MSDINRCSKNRKAINGIAVYVLLAFLTSMCFLVNGDEVVIENCVINKNEAVGDGGGIYLDANNVKAVNNTVVKNKSQAAGGGLGTGASKKPQIANSIFWDNSAATEASKEISGNAVSVFNSDIQQDGFDGINGNLNRLPLFVNTVNYYLQGTSPLIGKGSILWSPLLDKDGARRGESIDIGAHEYSTDGKTFYVNATMSDDSGCGLTQATAKKTIQAAIDASTSGDTIYVKAGTYTGTGNKNLDFGGRNIKLIGERSNGSTGTIATIIDCQNSGRGFYFHKNETPNAVLENLVVKNGSVSGDFPDGSGGAILLYDSSPTIKNCVFQNNTAAWGGAIEFNNSSSSLISCLISGNTSNAEDGGLGIFVIGASTVSITNCTIAGNTEGNSDMVRSVIGNERMSISIVNSIIQRLNVLDSYSSLVSVTYSCVDGGFSGTGNITWESGMTLFAASGDYRLHPLASVIDKADSSLAPVNDILGNAREDNPYVANAQSGITAPADMGAYEFIGSQDQAALTSRTLTVATDSTLSISYTVKDAFTATSKGTGSVASDSSQSYSLKEGVYIIDYVISGSNYSRTVYLTTNTTTYLNTNAKEIDLGTVSTYRRYDVRVNYMPFASDDSLVAYETETMSVLMDSIVFERPEGASSSNTLRNPGGTPVTKVETISMVYLPPAVGSMICEDIPIGDIALADQIVHLEIDYDPVSMMTLPMLDSDLGEGCGGGNPAEETDSSLDTYKRYKVVVNHMNGQSDTFYVMEGENVSLSTDTKKASITAMAGSGMSNREISLVNPANLTLTDYSIASFTASDEAASPENVITITANYVADSAFTLPSLDSDLDEDCGGGNPAAEEDASLDTYKRYKVVVNHTMNGQSDTFYVMEGENVSLSTDTKKASIAAVAGSGMSNREINLVSPANLTLTDYSLASFTASDDAANSENVITITANYQADSAVTIPSLAADLDEGYGGSNPSTEESSSLDTYMRYKALIECPQNNESSTSYIINSFYVMEGEQVSISLAEHKASITAVFGSGMTDRTENISEGISGLDLLAFTASSSTADDKNEIKMLANMATELTLPSLASDLGEGYGGGNPSTEESSSLDTSRRYKVIVRGSNGKTCVFFVMEGELVEFSTVSKNASITAVTDSGMSNRVETLEALQSIDITEFSPQSVTADGASSDAFNEIEIAANADISAAMTMPLNSSELTPGYGGQNPAASGTTDIPALNTYKRYNVQVTHTNSAVDNFKVAEGESVVFSKATHSASITAMAGSGLADRTFTLISPAGLIIISYDPESFIAPSSVNESLKNVIKVKAFYEASASATAPMANGLGLDTRKRFAYDLEATSDSGTALLSWQDKTSDTLDGTGYNRMEHFIVRSNQPGSIGAVSFPERVSTGQILSGNGLAIFAEGNLIDLIPEDCFNDELPPLSGNYSYRIYTKFSGTNKTDVIFWHDEATLSIDASTYRDSDADGISDSEESILGTDSESMDSDNDGITDYDEVRVFETNATLCDSDYDLVSDFDEIYIYETDPLKDDSDDDGLLDGEELGIYGTDPLDADSDDDGLTDYEEVIIYGTDPNNIDSDNDGLTDYEEINSATPSDPNKADTDGDGLSDWFEVTRTATNPSESDSDNDGIADSDEDSDSDGVSNIEEQASGMNPNLAAVDLGGYLAEKTVLEDAEDQSAARWTVLNTEASTVANIVDPDNSANRVIELSDSAMDGILFAPASAIPAGQLKLEWKFKTSVSYDIAVKLTTSEGVRYIHYTSNSSNSLGTGESIEYGLGSASGSWTTIRRDLQADLWNAQSGNNIISVDSITVKGSMYIDDISSMVYVDSDRDLIPNSIELKAGLNPYDASDASADADGDGIANAAEFMTGTPFAANADTDNDGIPDSVDPNPASSADTDSDGLPDDWENYYFGNLSQNASGDPDSDGVDNLTEYLLGRNPNAPAEDDTADTLKLRVFHP